MKEKTMRIPMQHLRFCMCAVLVAALCVFGCSREPTQKQRPVEPNTVGSRETSPTAAASPQREYPAQIDGREVFAEYPATSELHYEVGLGQCREKCPVEVRLVKGSMVLDSLKLEWQSASNKLTRSS